VLLYVPSPNDQFHAVGVPVVVSVNPTPNGNTPDVAFVVKLAVGAGTVTLMNVIAELLVPPEFVAFSITDQLPLLKV
jgi:hypothetical protein